METSNNRLSDRLAVCPEDAATLISVSRPTIYNLINAEGGIKSFTLGRRRLIPVDALRQWVNEQADTSRGA